jgi:hypothetical protein
MRFFSTRLISSFCLILCALLALPAFSANHAVPIFKAEYRLSHNGIEIGHVDLVVEKLDTNLYQLKSSTQTSGLLSFIRDDDVVEISQFDIANGRIRPLFYQYKEDLGEEQRNVKLRFNWQQLNVINSTKKQDWKQSISEGVLDKALMQVALMLDVENPNHPLDYLIADGGKLKNYVFSRVGEEKLTIANKQLNTIKLARKKDDKSLITYYWCAPALHNLPVLLQRKKPYGSFELRLIKATFEPTTLSLR